MLRRVAAFCRPLRPVLLLVSFPRSRSPVVGVLGLWWMWRDVPFACQRRPIVGVLRMCWLLPGSFDCFCCPHTSVHRPSIACLAVFLCSPGAPPPPPPPPRSSGMHTQYIPVVGFGTSSCGSISTQCKLNSHCSSAKKDMRISVGPCKPERLVADQGCVGAIIIQTATVLVFEGICYGQSR